MDELQYKSFGNLMGGTNLDPSQVSTTAPVEMPEAGGGLSLDIFNNDWAERFGPQTNPTATPTTREIASNWQPPSERGMDRPSLGERMSAHAVEGFRGTIVGQMADTDYMGLYVQAERMRKAIDIATKNGTDKFDLNKGGPAFQDYDLGVVTDLAGLNGMSVNELRTQRTELLRRGDAMKHGYKMDEIHRKAEYAAMPSAKGFVENAASVAAYVAGSTPTVENLIPVTRGATLVGTLGKGLLAGTAIGSGVDPVVQYMEIAKGVREQYDPTQTAMSALTSGVIVGGLNLAPHVVSRLINQVAEDLGKPANQVTVGEVANAIEAQARAEAITPTPLPDRPSPHGNDAAGKALHDAQGKEALARLDGERVSKPPIEGVAPEDIPTIQESAVMAKWMPEEWKAKWADIVERIKTGSRTLGREVAEMRARLNDVVPAVRMRDHDGNVQIIAAKDAMSKHSDLRRMGDDAAYTKVDEDPNVDYVNEGFVLKSDPEKWMSRNEAHDYIGLDMRFEERPDIVVKLHKKGRKRKDGTPAKTERRANFGEVAAGDLGSVGLRELQQLDDINLARAGHETIKKKGYGVEGSEDTVAALRNERENGMPTFRDGDSTDAEAAMFQRLGLADKSPEEAAAILTAMDEHIRNPEGMRTPQEIDAAAADKALAEADAAEVAKPPQMLEIGKPVESPEVDPVIQGLYDDALEAEVARLEEVERVNEPINKEIELTQQIIDQQQVIIDRLRSEAEGVQLVGMKRITLPDGRVFIGDESDLTHLDVLQKHPEIDNDDDLLNAKYDETTVKRLGDPKAKAKIAVIEKAKKQYEDKMEALHSQLVPAEPVMVKLPTGVGENEIEVPLKDLKALKSQDAKEANELISCMGG